ncbi:MAG: DUF3857 domain-containing protein [Terriglobales bacterium]
MVFRLAALVVSLSLLASANAREPQANPKLTRVDVVSEARNAFFLHSNLSATLKLTEAGLASRPGDPELLFLRMQAATLEADSAISLDSAVQLCRVLRDHPDARGFIAATHILDLAGNAVQFREIVPQIQRLLGARSPYAMDLRSAVVQAAADGVPNLSLVETSHSAGLITDWRIAGPFGTYSNVDFDRSFPPELDLLKHDSSGDRAVERVRYEDGALVLPDYFRHSGVFFASADVREEQPLTRLLRIDSPGTLQVLVDGKIALRKDNRFRTGPDVVSVPLHLSAGSHIIVLKFVPDATPIRVSLLPEIPSSTGLDLRLGDDELGMVESAYLNALLAYRRADYETAIAQLTPAHERHAFAAGDFLLAQSWAQLTDGSPEEISFLSSTLKLAPDAAQADYLLAKNADENGHTDETWQRITRVTAAHPDFAAGQTLKAEIAIPKNWTVDAIAAINAELEASPTCDNLLHAHKFYSAHEQYQLARQLEPRVDGCAPGSTAYAELLSSSDRHAEAAQTAAKLVDSHPLSRQARLLLVRELALAGNPEDAHRAAIALAHIAPNSEQFRRLANLPADMLAVADADESRAADFADSTPFYSPYRRDALAIAREATAAKYSGVSAVMLLDDRVSQLRGGNSVSVYVHRMIRVLTREGVENFGEVSIPDNADILELRTLKADGGIAEPEFSEHKSTVSMPALSPGDTIEQEYVVHFAHGGIEQEQKQFSFTFGSFGMPVAQARFVVITPGAVPVTTRQLAGAPGASAQVKDGERIQVWQQQDLPRTTQEASVPVSEILPTVKVYGIPQNGWMDVRDRYREQLIRAARIGPRVTAALTSMRISGLPAEDRLLRIYSFVSEKIRADQSSFLDENLTSAEDTLAAGEGDRSVALIALARAAGLSADLVLARDVSSANPIISAGAFTRPLVRVRFPLSGRSVVLDMQDPGMTLGGVSPRLDRREALLVPLIADEHEPPLIAFTSRQTEQSTAAGDLNLDADGGLHAKITITLGSWRSAQMRSTLATTEPGDRDQFFRDMANRIFNRATDVHAEARNEHNLAAPLQLVLSCRVPNFVDVSEDHVDIDQLVPALGLNRMYTSSKSRRFPLYVDTPLSELTTFRVSLPAGMRLAHRINGSDIHNSFGHYRVASRELGANTFEVTREFDIPVQVVTPGRYADFAGFASLIDAAERERFTLTMTGNLQQDAQTTGN